MAEAGEKPEEAPGRLNGNGPIGVIDIGSNSVRLVVYERLNRAPLPLFNEKALVGLGRGIALTGKLDAKAVDSALGAIRRYRALSDQMRAKELHVFATAAARDAKNGPEFITQIEKITRGSVSLLTGPEEARLSALGVISGFRDPNGVAGDLGGGSLEVIDIKGKDIGSGETFPLGGLMLEESSAKSTSKAASLAKDALAKSSVLKKGKGRRFYAIGGTWRSLARLHMSQTGYPLHVMHNYTIKADEALEFCELVGHHDLSSIESIDSVSKSRQPLLPYGAIVLSEIIRVMKPSEIVLSALGVREGHLYELLSAEDQKKDPLIVSCEELAVLRSRSPRHARELGPWAGSVIEAMGIEETKEEARLRQAASLLADIGWRAHPEYRGTQAVNIIANGAFVGVDHPGRAFLALAIAYRHDGPPSEGIPNLREIASARLIERARVLGLTLRVAYLISGAMPGVVPRTRVERKGKSLNLILPKDLEDVGGDRVEKQLGQLAKLAGLDASVVIEK
jgi:exopolyphosphatase/guanosine-5'-triphosphate,3'-diphosphate pyrophosphatase